MKKIIAICAVILMTASVFLPQQASAQAPQKMSYQAVIRDNSNALVTNQMVGMQISILQGSANGAAVYAETQAPTTNANGLASIEIGSGTLVSGNFASINWANGPYFIKTETDPAGGSNYTITGTSQLLSVPFALYAEKSGNPILQAGSGISIQNDSIINTAPNQQINLSGTGQTNVTGTYPNFTVNTPPYNAGTGINISGTNISAQNTNAIWNANKLQGKNIDTLTPALGNVLQYDGSKWKPSEKLPQMTTAQREALTNVYTGMTILNTNTDCIEYYNGTKWLGLCGTEGEVGSSETEGLQQGGQLILDSNLPGGNASYAYPLFSINSKIYVLLNTSSIWSFYEYNTVNKVWTIKSDLPAQLILDYPTNGIAFSNGSFGFAFTCVPSSGVSQISIYKYDPSLNVWSTSISSNLNYTVVNYNNKDNNFWGCLNNKAYFYLTADAIINPRHLVEFNITNNTIIDTSTSLIQGTNPSGFNTMQGHWQDNNKLYFPTDIGNGIMSYSILNGANTLEISSQYLYHGGYLNGNYLPYPSYNESILFDCNQRHYFLKQLARPSSADYFELYEVSIASHTLKKTGLLLDFALINNPKNVFDVNGKLYVLANGFYKLIL
jgi:hypothetical protein